MKGLFQSRSLSLRGTARGSYHADSHLLWGDGEGPCDTLPHWCSSENFWLVVTTLLWEEAETAIRVSIKPQFGDLAEVMPFWAFGFLFNSSFLLIRLSLTEMWSNFKAVLRAALESSRSFCFPFVWYPDFFFLLLNLCVIHRSQLQIHVALCFFFREREWEEQKREKEAPCSAGSPTWGLISGSWDRHLRQRQTVNWTTQVPSLFHS